MMPGVSSTFAIPFGLRQLIAAFLSRFVWVLDGLVQCQGIQKCGEKQRKESGDEFPQSKGGKVEISGCNAPPTNKKTPAMVKPLREFRALGEE